MSTITPVKPTSRKDSSEFPTDHTAVDQVVANARTAFQSWSKLSHRQRKEHLLNWRYEMVRRLEDIANLIHQENGKPYTDATLEVFSTLYHFTATIKRAGKLLKPKRVSPGWFCNYKAKLHYEPMGVVAIIAPWNMPFFVPMNQIIAAVAAGNSVVLKPSEITPLVGQLIAETAQASLPINNVVQVINGDGRTGEALIKSDIDKVAVTGSCATGQKVMQAAATQVTPVLMELGGKDALIVGHDANIPVAARRAVWGAFVLAGQACISVERCYVVEDVYKEFLDHIITETKKITIGQGGDIPEMATLKQVNVIRAQVQDALNKGAKLLHGELQDIKGKTVPPFVLIDVTSEMKIMQEETFGPVLTIKQVNDLEDAVQQANESPYALGASVFGHKGVSSAVKRMRAGMVSVNSVWAYALIPSLPFGGYGKSGFGRVHGDAGLLEFSNIKAVAEERFALPIDLSSFGLDKIISTKKILAATRLLFGKYSLKRIFNTT